MLLAWNRQDQWTVPHGTISGGFNLNEAFCANVITIDKLRCHEVTLLERCFGPMKVCSSHVQKTCMGGVAQGGVICWCCFIQVRQGGTL